MNRALRAATMGVLLLSPVALSACSAGQVTQTATQERDKVGAMAQVGDLTIRAVQFASPGEDGYERGDDADLQLAVVNTGSEDDTLVEVSGEGFGDVEFDDGSTGSAPADGIEIPADSAVFVDGDELGVTLTDLDEELTDRAVPRADLHLRERRRGHPPGHRRHAVGDGGARRGLRLPPRRGQPRRAAARGWPG